MSTVQRLALSAVVLITVGALTTCANDSPVGPELGPGPAATLAFSAELATTIAGTPITPAVAVIARDTEGKLATGFKGNVTVALTAQTATAGATLAGTLTVAAVSGVATFSDLAIDSARTYTLTATSGTLTSATSAGFDVEPGAADAGQSTIAADPTSLTADGRATSTLTVRLMDATRERPGTGGRGAIGTECRR